MPMRQVTLHQVYCCVCDVPGPSSVTLSGATFDAIMVGWQLCFSIAICPACSEAGRLPADIEDARVTLPAAPDVPVTVEGVS